MRATSSGRCIMLAATIALSASACAKAPPTDTGTQKAAMSEHENDSRTVDGYTYTTAPVEAKLGPHRYAFPANLYDNQMGPAVGGGVGLTLMWPELQAAAPGTRAARTMADHHRAISLSVDHIDGVPITTLLDRLTSSEATSEEGSVYRGDPRRRLDMRTPGAAQFGLTPYAIDETKMAQFGKAYEQQTGLPAKRNPGIEDDWYIARSTDGSIATFIKCDKLTDGRDGLTLEGGLLVADQSTVISGCTHYFVDSANNLSLRMTYPRVLLKDWSAMESAARAVLAKYKVE